MYQDKWGGMCHLYRPRIWICVCCSVLLFLTLNVCAIMGHSAYPDLHENVHQTPKQPHNVCPERCSCNSDSSDQIIKVDCSSRDLRDVPDLPSSTQRLSLRNNAIENVTCDSFRMLEDLQLLDLSANKISHLPSCVFRFQANTLQRLSISDNNLDHLQEGVFGRFSQLTSLDLSRNILSVVGNETSNLTQLRYLDLSFNKLDYLDADTFKGLFALRTLSLQNNDLDHEGSFHQDAFRDLSTLETLDIKANSAYPDEALAPLVNLRALYMEAPEFRSALRPGFRHLTNLSLLHLGTVYFGEQKRYKSWSFCIMEYVRRNFFENIRTTRDLVLNLSSCAIWSISKEVVAQLPTVVSLDLSHNPQIIFGLSNDWTEGLINSRITLLDVSNSYQSHFNQYLGRYVFKYLAQTQLKTLKMRNLQINGIDIAFLLTLEVLDVAGNLLSLEDVYKGSIMSRPGPHFKLRELHANGQHRTARVKRSFQSVPHPSDTEDLTARNHSEITFNNSEDEMKQVVPLSNSTSEFHNKDTLISVNRSVDSEMESPTILTETTSSGRSEWNGPFLHCAPPEILGSNMTIINICLPPDLEIICFSTDYGNSPRSVPHVRVMNNIVLRHVELANNLLTTWHGPVENVPSLEFLDLSQNQCENMSIHFFQYMTGLKTLLLNDNHLGSSLATDDGGLSFSTLVDLKKLDLSKNSIRALSSEVFFNNRELQMLNLSDNELDRFQLKLSPIRNMSILDLSVNLLPGLEEGTCNDLQLLKSRNANFQVNLADNHLLFTITYLPFLRFVAHRPDIFEDVELLQFEQDDGTTIHYKEMTNLLPILEREYLTQRFFLPILIAFFLLSGAISIFGVAYYNRWKLRYLYYISQRRMHVGEQDVIYEPDADVFIVYDEDEPKLRRFMQHRFRPRLEQMDIKYVLGEVDFPGGDFIAHATGAIIGTKKTIVLFSGELFDYHHRESEVNLAIMREMDMRSEVVVPIFVEKVDLTSYPPEIELFILNQAHRCLFFDDSDTFWRKLLNAVKDSDRMEKESCL